MPGFEELRPQTLVIILSIVLFAGLVHGTLGLGFPMIATPLLAILTDVLSATLNVLVPTLAVNLITIFIMYAIHILRKGLRIDTILSAHYSPFRAEETCKYRGVFNELGPWR